MYEVFLAPHPKRSLLQCPQSRIEVLLTNEEVGVFRIGLNLQVRVSAFSGGFG